MSIIARRAFLTFALATGLASVHCSSGSTSAVDKHAAGTGQVEIFSWWTAGGESEALKVITDEYKVEFPNVTLINAAVAGGAGSNAKEQLKQRMEDNLPPDTFQVHGGRELIGAWVRPKGIGDDSANKMADLSALFASEGWNTAFPSQLLDIVSYNGAPYSVPCNIHKANGVFYNKAIFAANNLTPPTTWDELYTVADALMAKGITPIAIGTSDPFPITMIFEDILLVKGASSGKSGADYSKAYFQGLKTGDDQPVKDTLIEMKKLFDYTNTDAATLSWDQAADKVAKGTAAMTFMGDWAKGYFASTAGGSLVADKDFGVFPAPGTSTSFIVVTDTFGLPKGAPSSANAIELLKVIGSPKVQVSFSLVKGSIPARKDVDASQFDSIGQKTIQDFASNDLIPSLAHGSAADAGYTTAIGTGMAAFFVDHDVDKMLGVLRTNYAQLQ